MNTTARRQALGLAISTLFCTPGLAVSLNPEGLGQALIYPYYTVRSVNGNAFNTYISVVNHSTAAKAMRVRVREGRAARSVLDFNLYLSPNDVWTGALIPLAGITSAGDGTRLITADNSCTDPPFKSIDLRTDAYSGANDDGFGNAAERTREGYIEMLEMATLSGATLAGITHNSAGVPANCGVVQGATPTTIPVGHLNPPTGGLSGTLTLINVNNGGDFTVNAEALADLSTRPFFRGATDPYPDFAASEIDPVSAVVANGRMYRSIWRRPEDAVSAVFMRSGWIGEYVLDTATASRTDFVTTMPTRQHYATPTQVLPPFSRPALWTSNCTASTGLGLGEQLAVGYFNREERGATVQSSDFPEPPPGTPVPQLCAAAAVGSVRAQDDPGTMGSPTDVLGSQTQGAYLKGRIPVTAFFRNGWIWVVPTTTSTLTSEPGSIAVDIATGTVTSGAHVFSGIPILGFSVRTFSNGTLTCGTSTCLGNYGGAFPFRYKRTISP